MALPNDRDATISSATQIPSTLLNNIQDMIIGGKHGEVRRLMPASMFYNTVTDDADLSFNLGTEGYTWEFTGAGGDLAGALSLNVGERIKDMFVTVQPGTVGDSMRFILFDNNSTTNSTANHDTQTASATKVREADPLAAGSIGPPPIIISAAEDAMTYAVVNNTLTSLMLFFGCDFLVDFP